MTKLQLLPKISGGGFFEKTFSRDFENWTKKMSKIENRRKVLTFFWNFRPSLYDVGEIL
jgi:hypothetical protein